MTNKYCHCTICKYAYQHETFKYMYLPGMDCPLHERFKFDTDIPIYQITEYIGCMSGEIKE